MTESRDIKTMRKQYEEIPVPDLALERIQAGIGKARAEKKVLTLGSFMRKSGMTAAAAMLAITVMTNINPTIANAMEQIPVIGAIAKVVNFRAYENHTNNFEAEIDVPKVEAENETVTALNRSIEEYAQTLIKQYEEELKANEGEGSYSLISTYDVVTDSDKYLSLRINTTEAVGSSAQYVKIFTIDKMTGGILTLDRLYGNQLDYKDKISQNIKEQMAAQMAADENIQYFYNSEYPEDDFKGITGEESFYFNKDGELVIAFDEYQVASGYMGAVEFTIPKGVV